MESTEQQAKAINKFSEKYKNAGNNQQNGNGNSANGTQNNMNQQNYNPPQEISEREVFIKIYVGETGVGKSYLASALGHQACIKGYKVLYYNMSKLFTTLKMSKADNSYLKEITKIEKQHVLILDDFGLHPFDAINCMSLLEIIEDRHGKSSTIIASQVPVNKWHELLGEKTLADAILDRIIHSSTRMELQGDSMRKKQIQK